MANTATLHKRHLDIFQKWLVSDGWRIEPTQNEHEVVRAKKKARTLVVYQKSNNGYLTIQGKDRGVIHSFFTDIQKRQIKKEEDKHADCKMPEM